MIKEINKENIDLLNNSLLDKEEVLSWFINNPYAKLLVCCAKDIVGYLYYSDIYDRIEINQITVFDKYRENGFGYKLMKYLISFGKPITLEVRDDNVAALSLYKKCGFKEISKRKGYYGDVDGILMILEKK